MKRFNDFDKVVAITTHSRAKEVGELAESVADNILKYGPNSREWALLAIDTSPHTYQPQNIASLSSAAKKMPVFYLGNEEFEKLAADHGQDFRKMFAGGTPADGRNLAAISAVDKTLIMLDDDMALTESLLYGKNKVDYPSLVSSGRFLTLEEFAESSYKREFDLVKALTSELGKKVKDTGISRELCGKAVGNRDRTIDNLMIGINDRDTYSFCHVEPQDINEDAVIRWQGLSAITEKADCHATASIQGISMLKDEDINSYGNMFVNYAVYDRPRKVGIATDWKESTLAAFGILNTSPMPQYPLVRGQDVSYRHMISKDNPVALVSTAIDHNRSHSGRPRLSRIYFYELLGSKVCRKFKESLESRGEIDIKDTEELANDQKRDIYRSVKRTCAMLDSIIKGNGISQELNSYITLLLSDFKNIFGIENDNSFWTDTSFKNKISSMADTYFRGCVANANAIKKEWEYSIKKARRYGIELRKL